MFVPPVVSEELTQTDRIALYNKRKILLQYYTRRKLQIYLSVETLLCTRYLTGKQDVVTPNLTTIVVAFYFILFDK